MRKLFFFAFCILSVGSFGQTTYLDQNRKPVDEGAHSYYKVIGKLNKKTGLFPVTTYYKSGKIESKGWRTTNQAKEGEFVGYFENGSIKYKKTFALDVPEGRYEAWYDNGNPRLIAEYVKTEIPFNRISPVYKVLDFWDENNVQKVIKGEGFYLENEELETGYGEIKNGFKYGEWKGSMTFPELTYVEYYENGKLAHGMSTLPSGITQQYSQIASVPDVPDGVDSFRWHVASNYKVPSDFSGPSGQIFVTFIVEPNGKMTELKILKGLGAKPDKEAIRAVMSYRKLWTPGKTRGVAQRVSYSMPIHVMVE